jgi:hypothetical protein
VTKVNFLLELVVSWLGCFLDFLGPQSREDIRLIVLTGVNGIVSLLEKNLDRYNFCE